MCQRAGLNHFLTSFSQRCPEFKCKNVESEVFCDPTSGAISRTFNVLFAVRTSHLICKSLSPISCNMYAVVKERVCRVFLPACCCMFYNSDLTLDPMWLLLSRLYNLSNLCFVTQCISTCTRCGCLLVHLSQDQYCCHSDSLPPRFFSCFSRTPFTPSTEWHLLIKYGVLPQDVLPFPLSPDTNNYIGI